MTTSSDRIPVPWPQRWEMLRERVLPAACLAATLAACAWLWSFQARVAPVAIGEVHARAVEVTAPADGELLPLAASGGEVQQLAQVAAGDVVARINTADGQTVDVVAPIGGVVTAVAAHPGQWLRKGRPLVTIGSPQPDYIICHRLDQRAAAPQPGQAVAVRRQAAGGQWVLSHVEAVGPAFEAVPAFHGAEAMAATRGLPIRIALPDGVELTPGAFVEVRFPPTPRAK